MACKTTVMNVEVNTDDEVNLVKDIRARSNVCYKCKEVGHFQRDCKYDGYKPNDGQPEQEGSYDSYDPVVGKCMTNLVATTPIMAKAMTSLYAEMNRQRDHIGESIKICKPWQSQPQIPQLLCHDL